MKKLSLVLVIAVLLLSSCLTTQPRVISVSGFGKVEAKADYLELRFSVITEGINYEICQVENDKQSAEILRFLSEDFGINEDHIWTENYSLREKYRYIEGQGQVSDGYISENRLRIRLMDIERYQDLIPALLQLGVNNISDISFGVSNTSEYEQLAYQEAFEVAKSKAEAILLVDGYRLGDVLSISTNSSYSQPLARAVYAEADFSAGNTVSPGEQTVQVNIQVTFKIK